MITSVILEILIYNHIDLTKMLKLLCATVLVIYLLQVEANPAFQYEADSEEFALNNMDLEEQSVELQGLSPATQYRQAINFICPSGQALFRLRSVHNNGQEDRTWQFDCRKASTAALTHCTYTAPNILDQPLIGDCSDGFVATGFRSLSYHTGTRDRQFNVRCCKTTYEISQCRITPYINGWDGVMDYSAPSGHVIAGIYSHHENSKEDRRYVVKICRAQC